MGEPVQITITVDESGAISGMQQVGAGGERMNAQLTASTAQVNERIKQTTAAFFAQKSALDTTATSANKAAAAFQGIASDQTKASLAGRILEQQFGVTNRALNQVISHSQILGPLMAGLFNVSIFVAAGAAVLHIAEKIGEASKQAEEHRVAWIDIDTTAQDTSNKIIDGINQQKQKFIELTQGPMAAMRFEFSNMRSIAVGAFKDIASEMEKAGAEFSKEGGLFFGNAPINSDIAEEIAGVKANMNAALHKAAADNPKDLLAPFIAEQNVLNKAIEDGNALIARRSAAMGADKSLLDPLKQEVAFFKQLNGQISLQIDEQKQIKINADQTGIEKQQEFANETMQIYDRIAENRLQGIARIRLEEEHQIKDAEDGLLKRMGLSRQEVEGTALFEAQKARIHQDAEKKIQNMQAQTLAQTVALQNEAELSGLTGDARIIESARQKADKIREQTSKEPIDYDTYAAAIVAINKIRNDDLNASDESWAEKRKALMERDAEEFRDANDAAALASVAPWQKAYAQIVIESERRLERIDQQERAATAIFGNDEQAMIAITALAQAKRGAVWAEENEKIRAENQRLTEQLGSDLESIFNDISSGNIGQRILKNMEKLFFQIVAQWLLTTQTMGSTFGKVFGTLIGGPGSTLENSSGGGIASLINMFGGSTTGSFASFGAGAPASGTGAATFNPGFLTGAGAAGAPGGAASSGFGNIPPSFLFGSDSNSVPGANGGGSLTTASISSVLGDSPSSSSSSSSSSKGMLGTVASLFSSKGTGTALALALALGGGKLGGAGQIGSIISSIGLMAALNPTGALYGLLESAGLASGAGAAALFGVAGPGLIGFGLGEKLGTVPGSILGGVGGAVLAGLTFGGPVGAILGGIAGLLGGLFGGLFGSSKRKKQANALFDSQIGPAITKIEDDFKGFSVDFPTAISQLEDLRTQSQSQLKALKGQGSDVFNKKVSPAIDAAEAQINQYETERLRRSGLVFGPPQFHDGGYVNAAGATMLTRMPGELVALIKHGEFVTNPQATAKNRGLLEHINAGGSIQSGMTIQLNVSTMDSKSFDGWVKSGGADMLVSALSRAKKEGRF